MAEVKQVQVTFDCAEPRLDVRIGVGLTGEERVAALEAEAARLIPLGARRLHLLPADDGDKSCLVMQDVEGNEFCLD